MCWFGDGAASEGAVHEAMNLAGVHKLPVVFLCENNGYAISVPLAADADRVDARSGPGATASGRRRSTGATPRPSSRRRWRDRPRPGRRRADADRSRGARITAHSSQDDDAYREAEAKAAAANLDPIPRLRARLIELGGLDDEEDEVARKTIEAEVLAARDRRFANRSPTPARARRWLYADG